MSKVTEALTLEQAMGGILALLAAEREERINSDKTVTKNLRKTEVVLAESGMTPAQIAGLLGKKSNSVAKTIQRARTKESREDKVNGEE